MQGGNLEARAKAQVKKEFSFTGLLQALCSTYVLTQCGTTCPDVASPVADGPCHINHQPRQCPMSLPISQFDGSIFSMEIPFSPAPSLNRVGKSQSSSKPTVWIWDTFTMELSGDLHFSEFWGYHRPSASFNIQLVKCKMKTDVPSNCAKLLKMCSAVGCHGWHHLPGTLRGKYFLFIFDRVSIWMTAIINQDHGEWFWSIFV